MKYHWSSSSIITKIIDLLEQYPNYLPYISFPVIKILIQHYKRFSKPSKNMKRLLILISKNDETFMSFLQRGGMGVLYIILLLFFK